jgi:adhesin transport system membrane fusion protein
MSANNLNHPDDRATTDDETRFIDNAHRAVLENSPRGGRLLLWAICVFLLAAFSWAYYAELDEVTRGPGRVIPSSQLQLIQNLEGGMVSDILIKEGEQVDAGQVLIKIDDTLSGASYRESRLHYLALRARAFRLHAEANDEPCNPPSDVLHEAPRLVEQELRLRQTRQKELDARLAAVNQQIEQNRHELEELRVKHRHLTRNFQLLTREMEMTQPLVKEGAISEVEILRLEQKINETRGQIDTNLVAIDRVEHSYEEITLKGQEIELAFRNEARAELSKINEEISRLEETNIALQDRVLRTQVRSPMKGIIKRIMVTTIGEVVQPGQNIVEIVPLEDTLFVAAQIDPADIAFITYGQKAVIKLTAYDFAVYGGLQGIVEHISADSIIDDKGASHYLVRIRTDHKHFVRNNMNLEVIPGMTAQVDIITGKKTVLEYLFNPVLRARQNALRER